MQQPSSPQNQPSELEFNYAWSWFQYHAEQRLRAFHFYLVIVTLLVLAFGAAVEQGHQALQIAIGLLGVVVSLGFAVIDVRNEELVDCGRVALDDLEERMGPHVHIRADDEARSHLAEAFGRGPLGKFIGAISKHVGGFEKPDGMRQAIVKHRFWLRATQLAFGLAFLVGIVWAMVR